MGEIGKKYQKAISKVDRLQRYTFQDAINLIIDCSYAKFDETVDIAVRLGVDPRHADQMVRGTVVLPHGVGKVVRVLVFAKGEKEKCPGFEPTQVPSCFSSTPVARGGVWRVFPLTEMVGSEVKCHHP